MANRMRPSTFALRQWSYDLDSNLLFRPAVWLVSLLGLGALLPMVEAALAADYPAFAALSRFLSTEPASAQLLMATVAGAVMTVVSVVYSILLVALSLASMQFSTRILAGFMRDRVSRSVLGLFVGTLAYCLAVVRAIHTDPPFVPGVALTLGLALALCCLGGLVLFIHHIVKSIQANVLVDRIATETEAVLDAVYPPRPGPDAPFPEGELPHVFPAPASGYIQLIDVAGLLRFAPGARVRVERPNGAFIARGLPLLRADRPFPAGVGACVDIGAMRTMQDDAEFGFRQIVDIALKAISPAINDPSTGATCIDHLGRLLLHTAGRECGPRVHAGNGALVYLPVPRFVDLLDLSVEQLRQYGRADMAICLRLMRVLGEVAPTVHQPAARARIREHADAIRHEAAQHFPAHDRGELEVRYERVVAGSG